MFKLLYAFVRYEPAAWAKLFPMMKAMGPSKAAETFLSVYLEWIGWGTTLILNDERALEALHETHGHFFKGELVRAWAAWQNYVDVCMEYMPGSYEELKLRLDNARLKHNLRVVA